MSAGTSAELKAPTATISVMRFKQQNAERLMKIRKHVFHLNEQCEGVGDAAIAAVYVGL